MNTDALKSRDLSTSLANERVVGTLKHGRNGKVRLLFFCLQLHSEAPLRLYLLNGLRSYQTHFLMFGFPAKSGFGIYVLYLYSLFFHL